MSDSDGDSEDSENLPWGVVGRRAGAGKEAKGGASAIEEGIAGGRRGEESRKGQESGGGGGRALGVDSGSKVGASDDNSEDEADEDIHARQAPYYV